MNDAIDFGSDYNDFGPGDQYTINTLKEFDYSVTFYTDGYIFNYMSISVSQWTGSDWNWLWMEDSVDQLGMGEDLRDGLALVVSNWGSDDAWTWLSKDRCSGTCNYPSLTIKDISVKTGPFYYRFD